MDTATASVVASAIVTSGTVAVALIQAFSREDKAVDEATRPLHKEIRTLKDQNSRLANLVRSLGGNPDEE